MTTPAPLVPPLVPQWIAFVQHRCIGQGLPAEVASRVKAQADADPNATVLVLDADSSQPVEIDLRGTLAAVLKRLPVPVPAAPVTGEESPATDTSPRGPGRPKLGVVAREVTLLPRHWDWLNARPGGASVALRKMVEQAQRSQAQADQQRQAQESTYRFMHAIGGDLRGFEEASRALFANKLDRLQTETENWPADVRSHLLKLAARAMPDNTENTA